MKRSVIAALVIPLLGILLGFAIASDPINPPVLQQGDRWEFRAAMKEGITSTTDRIGGTYEVVFQQGRLEVFQITDGNKTVATAGDAEDLKRLIPFNQDDLQLLNFPLFVGKTWTAEYRHTQAGARKPQRRWATLQVEKVEEIKTEAGGFQAIRIKGNGQTYGGNVKREWDYFYTPDTKSIVKFYYDSGVGTKSGKMDIELLKFVPGTNAAKP